MAFFEDIFKGDPVTGVIVGIGAVVLAPTIGRVLRPAAKAVIKGGIVLYRETLAEVGEATSDLVAEARAELDKSNTHEKPIAAESGLILPPETH